MDYFGILRIALLLVYSNSDSFGIADIIICNHKVYEENL